VAYFRGTASAILSSAQCVERRGRGRRYNFSGPGSLKESCGPTLLRIVLSFSVVSGVVVLAAFAASGQRAYDALCFSLTFPSAGTPLAGGPKKNFSLGSESALGGPGSVIRSVIIQTARQDKRAKENMESRK
jgi:hypothetical protein